MHSSDLLAVVVRDRRRVADAIDEFTLTRPGGDPLPEWEAGAHVDLLLGDGIVRQYSLCSDPADATHYRIAVLREEHGRGGSVRAHDTLRIGTEVSIRPPRNHFPLVRALEYVLIAGGIGITPVLALAAAAHRSGRPWRLIYTGRDESAMAYTAELRERYGDAPVIHYSRRGGRLDLAAALADSAPGTAVYACGPHGLIEAAEHACAPLAAVDVFAERFVARDRSASAAGPFEVSLALSGLTLTVPPTRSILAVAEDHGVVAPASCREGTCGTCETGVVSGEIDHRDSILSAEERAEGESMMICVSRCAGSRLVLEL
ncbi:PDR/VanB family oxidoreductase [Nocardia mexicana]|uniref:Ferredoxin-NADP reductase n=1 Tax=Nocardia mexicana TaxID=279262 RepID=A0A370HG23_9NOCA|nr:PDR/VanB family oxidoreductase [Nocardia mexicana]RDI56012.1 ferredoxin-NADP reductase [Nocardia mexicana]